MIWSDLSFTVRSNFSENVSGVPKIFSKWPRADSTPASETGEVNAKAEQQTTGTKQYRATR